MNVDVDLVPSNFDLDLVLLRRQGLVREGRRDFDPSRDYGNLPRALPCYYDGLGSVVDLSWEREGRSEVGRLRGRKEEKEREEKISSS